MPISKNAGQKLISKFKGLLDLIPPEFRAKLGITQTVQQVPLDVEIDPVAGAVVETKLTQERTNERTKTIVEIEGDVTDTLVSQVRLSNGQIATRTRSFIPEGTALTPPVGAVDGDQKNLGIGFLDQTVIDASLPGPTVFSTRIAPDGVVIQIARTRKLGTNITESESISSGVWTKIYREGETDQVATEVIETRSVLT